jgi:hypothetical protein
MSGAESIVFYLGAVVEVVGSLRLKLEVSVGEVVGNATVRRCLREQGTEGDGTNGGLRDALAILSKGLVSPTSAHTSSHGWIDSFPRVAHAHEVAGKPGDRGVVILPAVLNNQAVRLRILSLLASLFDELAPVLGKVLQLGIACGEVDDILDGRLQIRNHVGSPTHQRQHQTLLLGALQVHAVLASIVGIGSVRVQEDLGVVPLGVIWPDGVLSKLGRCGEGDRRIVDGWRVLDLARDSIVVRLEPLYASARRASAIGNEDGVHRLLLARLPFLCLASVCDAGDARLVLSDRQARHRSVNELDILDLHNHLANHGLKAILVSHIGILPETRTQAETCKAKG